MIFPWFKRLPEARPVPPHSRHSHLDIRIGIPDGAAIVCHSVGDTARAYENTVTAISVEESHGKVRKHDFTETKEYDWLSRGFIWNQVGGMRTYPEAWTCGRFHHKV